MLVYICRQSLRKRESSVDAVDTSAPVPAKQKKQRRAKMSKRHREWLIEMIEAADRPEELEGKDLSDDKTLRNVYYSCGYVHPDWDWEQYKRDDGL